MRSTRREDFTPASMPFVVLQALQRFPRRAMGYISIGCSFAMKMPDFVTSQHPRFREAVVADALSTLRYRGEGNDLGSRWRTLGTVVRLAWDSDAFFAQVCYRAKARLQALGVPLLPRVFHRLAMLTSQVCIGDPVVIRPGLYLPHGQVVVDGFVTIGEGAVLFPWITIGLRAGVVQGPTLGRDVHVGTGARVIGPVTLGDNVMVGANAFVNKDVPAGHVAMGVPAVSRPRSDLSQEV